MPRSREEGIKEVHPFHTFYPKILSPWNGGHEIYNFLSPYLPIWLSWSFDFQEDDADEDGRQPIAAT